MLRRRRTLSLKAVSAGKFPAPRTIPPDTPNPGCQAVLFGVVVSKQKPNSTNKLLNPQKPHGDSSARAPHDLRPPPTRAAVVVASQAGTPPGVRQFCRRGYSSSPSSSCSCSSPPPPPRQPSTLHLLRGLCHATTRVSARHTTTAAAAATRARHRPRLPSLLERLIPLAMTTAAEGDHPVSLLLRLLDLPDGFAEKEVLRRLGPRALASLAGTGHRCAAAVALTALMRWAKDEKSLPLRRGTFAYCAPRLCLREACSLAARGGHLEVLEWLHSTECPCDSATCCAAAAGGHLEVLRWLHGTGCRWDSTSTCEAAAAGGHLATLKWLHNTGCPWDEDTCYAAARGGYLEALKWLHNTGCPWNSHTCRAAAARGDLDVLKWLHNTRCPWGSYTCDAAAAGILKY